MTFDFLHGAPSPGALVMPPAPLAVPPGATMPGGMIAYWGDFHSHSTVSDGSGPPRMAFATARANGLHFFALTDHDAYTLPEEWAEIGNAANAANIDGAFIAVRGFEYTNSTSGHIAVYNTTTYVSRADPNYDTLRNSMRGLPGKLTPSRSSIILTANMAATLTTLPTMPAWRTKSFCRKSATMATDTRAMNHNLSTPCFTAGTSRPAKIPITTNSWGNDSTHRVGILAPVLTRAKVIDALRARRVFATEDKNLALALQANGAWMGATIVTTSTINFTLTLIDPNMEGAQFYLYDNGVVVSSQSFAGASTMVWNVSIAGKPSHDYFVRAVQADGDIAEAAPIWTDATPLPASPLVDVPPTEKEKPWDLGRVSVMTARTADLYHYVDLEACASNRIHPRG